MSSEWRFTYAPARELHAFPGAAQAGFIALTGYGRDHGRERSASAHFDHHLMKPVDMEKLGALLAETGARQVRSGWEKEVRAGLLHVLKVLNCLV